MRFWSIIEYANVAYSAATLPLFTSNTIEFNLLENDTLFTSLFREYRIDKVVTTWMFDQSIPICQTAALVLNVLPRLYSCFDPSDQFTNSAIIQYLGHDNTRIKSVGERGQVVFKRKWIPAVLEEVYTGATASAQQPKFRQWINTTATGITIPHYALYWALEAPGVTSAVYTCSGNCRVFAKVFFSLRGFGP